MELVYRQTQCKISADLFLVYVFSKKSQTKTGTFMSLHYLESHFSLHKAQFCSTESTMCDHHVFIFALVFFYFFF